MAGGIFDNAPFQFNMKCVIFAAILMILFAVAPVHSYWVLAAIPIVTGLFIYGYHSLYDCKVPFNVWSVVVASLGLMAAYWFSPPRTRTEIVMYFFIFVYGYVAMAFYDHLFDCSIPLKSGVISLTAVFKPSPASE